MKEVLLVGNPNSGKTTLFNSLTKSNEHIGNWHGVTVENKKKSFFVEGEEYVLIDTPGIYSLCALSFEEEVAVDCIFQNSDKKIINICDQNNLQRNLYLTLCLLEKGCDVVLVVNEIDKKPIFKVDCKTLSKFLGIDVVVVNAEKKIGFEKLYSCLRSPKKKAELPYLSKLSLINDKNQTKLNMFETIKAYEKDDKYFSNLNKDFQNFCNLVPENSMEIIAKLRYDFLDKTIKASCQRTEAIYGKSKLDKIVLNKWLAFPVFFVVLMTIFWLTFFCVGSFFSDILTQFLNLTFSPFLNFLQKSVGQTWFFDLFNVAIFGGLSLVLSFLPQIVLLFFFLSILEDSGYMTRIAFIFEDFLGKIGLSGKSVYTLLMGFGCSTSAIMTARNMDDKNAKTKTALLCPYMSCSAKIPIYTVVGGAFFGVANIFAIFGMYILGVVVAIIISKILDLKVLKSEKQSFILEFPPYRKTSLKRVGKNLSKNSYEFLIKVGSVMIAMNVVVWALSSFSFSFAYVGDGNGVSMLETIGKTFAPLFAPLGFNNWAIVSSLLAGLVAKEVVVSSIAMFNGIDSSATRLVSQSILLSSSTVFFSNSASVLSFMVFCLLYTPCIASIAMLSQEIGKKWTVLSILIQLTVAYIVSFLVYNIAFAFEIFGFAIPFICLLSIAIIGACFWFVVKKTKNRNICSHCDNCNKHCKKK